MNPISWVKKWAQRLTGNVPVPVYQQPTYYRKVRRRWPSLAKRDPKNPEFVLQLASPKRDARRAAEERYGPLSGRQWKKLYKRLGVLKAVDALMAQTTVAR